LFQLYRSGSRILVKRADQETYYSVTNPIGKIFTGRELGITEALYGCGIKRSALPPVILNHLGAGNDYYRNDFSHLKKLEKIKTVKPYLNSPFTR
jgi:hypothetical protein